MNRDNVAKMLLTATIRLRVDDVTINFREGGLSVDALFASRRIARRIYIRLRGNSVIPENSCITNLKTKKPIFELLRKR
jgi:hypothetical protein